MAPSARAPERGVWPRVNTLTVRGDEGKGHDEGEDGEYTPIPAGNFRLENLQSSPRKHGKWHGVRAACLQTAKCASESPTC